MEKQTTRLGVDDIAGALQILGQVLFFVWVTLNEQKWGHFCRAPKN